MQLKLRWRNPNTLVTTVSIYRNDAIVAPADLGEPVVTLAGDITEWTDTNVLANKTYYYTWKVNNSGNSVFTKPVEVKSDYSLGPGPSELMYGDMSLGYFGQLTYAEMFTSQELIKLVGVSGNLFQTGTPTWYKFARNGKILYIPSVIMCYNTSFFNLYRAGAIFGTDDNGPWVPTGATPINQKKVVSKGIHDFIIRLPTSIDDRNNPGREIPAGGGNRSFSEAADIVYPIVMPIPSSQRLPNMANNQTNTLSGGYFLAGQEKEAATTTNVSTLGDFSTTSPTGAFLEKSGTVAITTGIGWYPILELIPTKLQEVVL